MSLYLACGLTMAMEAAYFFLIGYRGRDFLTVCLAANAATNLTLNLILRNTGSQIRIVILLEITAVAAEYAAYCLALKPSRTLLMHTVIANLLSFSIGGALIRLLLFLLK